MRKVLFFITVALFATQAAGQDKAANYEPLTITTAWWYQNAKKEGNSFRADTRFQVKNDSVFVDNAGLKILSEKRVKNVRMAFCEGGNVFTFYTDERGVVYRVELALKKTLMTFDNGERSIVQD
jgi:flagellar basal body rod protein FlgG